jgi:two-component system NarL family sensor kinase
VAVLAAVALAVLPGPLGGLVEVENPYAVDALMSFAEPVAAAAPPLLSLLGLVAVGDLVVRARPATGVERVQFRLLRLALAVLVAALLAQAALDAGDLATPEVLQALRLLAFLAVPLALAVALTRYRLYDADRLVDRAVVYAVISGGIVAVYVVTVAVLGGALGRRVDIGASVLAAAVAAVLFPLLRDGTQRLVARRLYSWRDDPYAVLSGLTSRLSGLQPDEVLHQAVALLRDVLRLPWVSVSSAAGVLAEAGTRPAAVETLELRAQGTVVGTLGVGLRTGERELSTRDLRLLTDVASQLAGAVRSGQLARDVQTSRERLVHAREEERRRLRRDLHDGLGPVLTGVVLGLDGVAALAERDAPAAVALATRVRDDAMSAVDEVRRVVHDLRPPALDQLGLLPALEQRAAALSTGDLAITVESSDGERLRGLPAAVEVACYAVAVEAMHNVVRHAAASRCSVTVDVSDELRLEVRDDGSGRHGPAGVGTASMHERAAELGGTAELSASSGTGTVLRLRLPLDPR